MFSQTQKLQTNIIYTQTVGVSAHATLYPVQLTCLHN
jgi:hypothetical protein